MGNLKIIVVVMSGIQSLMKLIISYRVQSVAVCPSSVTGQVDLIIAAEDTRKYAVAAFEMLYTKGSGEPVRKHTAK